MSETRMHYFTIEQRETLRSRLASLIARLQEETAGGLQLANRSEETDDDAIADLETSLDAAALERTTLRLRETESALARLRDPAYGLCLDCGADIPYVRLLADPAAQRCVACQSERERGKVAAHKL
jgi:DnaK suppressor protein